MKSFTILAIIIFLSSFLLIKVEAQSKNQIPKGITTKSTPIGDKSLTPQPSDGSERIKYRIEIKRDSSSYSLKAEKYEKGAYIYEHIMLEQLDFRRKVYKGDIIIFEMVPDVSNTSLMTLFTYFPSGIISYQYLVNSTNKRIKYRNFADTDNTKFNTIPLIICYIDDEQNNVEKLLDNFSEKNLITITSKNELQEKILKNITKCLLVYYNLTEE